jgi:hypothetical protein
MRPAKLVRTRLVVEVEDQTWQRQLFALTPHILNNLDRTLGRGLVEDPEFRIVPRRREPWWRAIVGRRPCDHRPGDARPVQALPEKAQVENEDFPSLISQNATTGECRWILQLTLTARRVY